MACVYLFENQSAFPYHLVLSDDLENLSPILKCLPGIEWSIRVAISTQSLFQYSKGHSTLDMEQEM